MRLYFFPIFVYTSTNIFLMITVSSKKVQPFNANFVELWIIFSCFAHVYLTKYYNLYMEWNVVEFYYVASDINFALYSSFFSISTYPLFLLLSNALLDQTNKDELVIFSKSSITLRYPRASKRIKEFLKNHLHKH